MLDQVFSSVVGSSLTLKVFLLCSGASVLFGALIAFVYMFKNTYTKTFVMTLALLPLLIQVVIMLVNGNLGTGVAIMGAFSLIRFRSAPGNAKDLCGILVATAIGLANGVGYIGFAFLTLVIFSAAFILYTYTKFGEPKSSEKNLKIVIPEGLDYTGLFDDIFLEYTQSHELLSVKTTNMGSMFKLNYKIVMKNDNLEKQLIDAVRCRNGNLDIMCSRGLKSDDEL